MAAKNKNSKNKVVKPVRTSEYDENRGSYMDADGNYVYTTWEKRGKKWVEVPVCTIPLEENGENAANGTDKSPQSVGNRKKKILERLKKLFEKAEQ